MFGMLNLEVELFVLFPSPAAKSSCLYSFRASKGIGMERCAAGPVV
jgi:hypothetical protein